MVDGAALSIDGVLGNKSVQLGDYLKAGTRIPAVVPIDALYVDANFKETQIEPLRVAGAVTLDVDAVPDHPVHGTIASLAPASGATFSLLPPENTTGNFTKIVQRVPVRIELPHDDLVTGLLRPGLSVVVTADRRRMPQDAGVLATARP